MCDKEKYIFMSSETLNELFMLIFNQGKNAGIKEAEFVEEVYKDHKREKANSIEPKILEALKLDKGLSTADVCKITRLKENTVRTVLRRLLINGKVKKDGRKWFGL